MKIQRAVGTATVVLAVVSLVCLAAYFLALHDIAHDYASPQMLSEQGYPSPGTLPAWTTCALEWRVIAVGFWPMVLFHVFFLGGRMLQWYRQREHSAEQALP